MQIEISISSINLTRLDWATDNRGINLYNQETEYWFLFHDWIVIHFVQGESTTAIVLGIDVEHPDRASVYHFNWLIESDDLIGR